MIVAVGHDDAVAAQDADHQHAEVGEQLGKLPERCMDHRAIGAAMDADQADPAIDKGDHVDGAGHLQATDHGARDFDFR